ncbi:MAG TPA: HAD family phosphatase [Acidimicrobiales bacterium]|nr:HAD family phosphatase [Acidimicrobiales bacterium]
MTARAVDAVVFDLGGVLIDWNPRHLYRELFDDDTEMERFLADICTLEWHVAHDRGEGTEASCVALAERHPDHAPLIMAWSQRSEDMVRGELAETVEILAELKRDGVPLFVLSNMEPETFPRRVERFDFLSWFDGYVISGLEGVVKPEPQIFELLLQRFALDATRTVFIDDSTVNVDAAIASGLRAIHFTSPAQLRHELEALGLLR